MHLHFRLWGIGFQWSRPEALTSAGTSPLGHVIRYAVVLEIECTNNQTECKELMLGFQLLLVLKIAGVTVKGNLEFVIG